MRLVVATPLYPPEIGGPATYAVLLEEGLPEKGIETTVVKFSDVRALPKVLRHIHYFFKVLGAASRADAVYALDPVSVGYPAMLAAKLLGKPFFLKVVGDYAWEQGVQRFGITENLDAFAAKDDVPPSVRALRGVQAGVARAARAVIVPSHYLAGIIKSWGMPEPTVVYNAVAIDRIGTAPEAVAALPRPLVVSVGRLVPWKGMSALIDAVAALRERGTTASLAIVGDGPEFEALRAQAKEKLPDHCVLTGRLSREDTLATIRQADAFALNSSYEGLSHLLIEALRLGTPIVATRAGGNAELVEDNVTGILVPLDDPEALMEALKRVIKNASFKEALKRWAAEKGSEFEPDAMLAKTAALLKENV